MPGLHQGRSLEEHEALSLGVVLYKEDGVVLYDVGIICERCEARGLSRCLSTDVRVLADGGLKFHSCSSCKAAQKGCSLYGQGLGIRHYAADQAAFSFRDSDERPDRVRTARSHREAAGSPHRGAAGSSSPIGDAEADSARSLTDSGAVRGWAEPTTFTLPRGQHSFKEHLDELHLYRYGGQRPPRNNDHRRRLQEDSPTAESDEDEDAEEEDPEGDDEEDEDADEGIQHRDGRRSAPAMTPSLSSEIETSPATPVAPLPDLFVTHAWQLTHSDPSASRLAKAIRSIPADQRRDPARHILRYPVQPGPSRVLRSSAKPASSPFRQLSHQTTSLDGDANGLTPGPAPLVVMHSGIGHDSSDAPRGLTASDNNRRKRRKTSVTSAHSPTQISKRLADIGEDVDIERPRERERPLDEVHRLTTVHEDVAMEEDDGGIASELDDLSRYNDEAVFDDDFGGLFGGSQQELDFHSEKASQHSEQTGRTRLDGSDCLIGHHPARTDGGTAQNDVHVVVNTSRATTTSDQPSSALSSTASRSRISAPRQSASTRGQSASGVIPANLVLLCSNNAVAAGHLAEQYARARERWTAVWSRSFNKAEGETASQDTE